MTIQARRRLCVSTAAAGLAAAFAWTSCGTAETLGRDCPLPGQVVAGTSLQCGDRQIEGTMLRGDLPACSASVTTGCVTSAQFAAGDVARLAPGNLRINETVLGVVGTLTPRVVSGSFGLCEAEGETDCIVVVDFVAVDTTSLAPKIATGESVGGVAGTGIRQAARACASNVQVGCYANDRYPADGAREVAQCILSDPLSLRSIE